MICVVLAQDLTEMGHFSQRNGKNAGLYQGNGRDSRGIPYGITGYLLWKIIKGTLKLL